MQPVSAAFAKQVQQMPTPELQNLAKQLSMELVLARFSRSGPSAAELQTKLTYVEGQLRQREASTAATRFQYQRELGGMSCEQLTSARAKEACALFLAELRKDPAGAKEAKAKLGLIDQECAKREHDLYAFQQSLRGMTGEQLDGLGDQLTTEVADALRSPTATVGHKENAFNRLALLIGELLNRGSKTPSTDWLYSK